MIDKKPSPKNKDSNKGSDSQNQTAAAKQNDSAVRTSKNVNLKNKEFGGFEANNLLEPTRFGDWEVKGRCSDF